MFCKNCGTQIIDNAKFCDNCGAQTAAEQKNILAQQEKNRKENPPPYLKNAIILTIIFFVSVPVAYFLVEDPLAISVGLIVAGVFSALALILGISQQKKYYKK